MSAPLAAAEFLLGLLADGPVPSSVAIACALDAGHKRRAIERGRTWLRDAGLVSRARIGGSYGFWELRLTPKAQRLTPDARSEALVDGVQARERRTEAPPAKATLRTTLPSGERWETVPLPGETEESHAARHRDTVRFMRARLTDGARDRYTSGLGGQR